ncbi:YbaN family protein [Arhodomonas sp. SL1]|uniref:YbaN family protein n=1 Tax=Arhodomonas sp. SL1 TaxID=3425691 RepID=UPI003F881C21
MKRYAWQGLALACIGLGGLGVALPLLPTTPFLLLAAYAASRSSPALARWIAEHPRFGPPLADWQERRAIAPGAKRTAVGLIAVSWGIMWLTVEPLAARAAVSLLLLGVTAFLLTRPS